MGHSPTPTQTLLLSPTPTEARTPTPTPTEIPEPTPTLGKDSDGDGSVIPFDCDDRNSSVYPGAIETCDEVDEDCDGDVDEGDQDGDGAPTCPLPDVQQDCDDADPLASPLHRYEYMDGIDNTCNGTIDETQEASRALWILSGPREEELGWCGSAMGSVGDLNRDGFGDFIVTCPRATGVDQGVAHVFFGSGKRLESPTDTSRLSLLGDFNYSLAGSAFAAGDFNGDGSDDLVVGQPGWSRVSLLLGPLSPRGEAIDLGSLAKTGNGEFLGSAGAALALVDLNGDGRSELMVGSPSDDGFTGKTVLIPGGLQLPNDFELEDVGQVLPNGFIYPDTPPFYGGEGSALAAIGDFDNDGFQDVAVGSFFAGGVSDNGGDQRQRSGAVEILYGGELDTMGSTERRLIIAGPKESYFGASLGGAGDVNGDGIDDLVVGAPRADAPATAGGRAYIIAGGSRLSGSLFVEELGERVLGTVRCNREGCQMGTLYNTHSLGDINGDGLGDLAFGAVGYSTSTGGDDVADRGAIGVFLGKQGPWEETQDLFNADAFFIGTRADDKLGALGPVGDLDGDGFDELLLGAFEAQVDPDFDSQDTGRAYLFWGYGRRPMGAESRAMGARRASSETALAEPR